MAASNMADSSHSTEEGETGSFSQLPSQQERDSDTQQDKRFTCLKTILSKCTEQCFAPARLSKLSASLPDIRNKNPEAFDSITQQLIDGLKSNVTQELELMINQENLMSLCQELDEITAKVDDNTEPAWRPTGDPNKDIKDHTLEVKIEFRDKLKKMLQQLQEKNKAMQEELMSTRTEITNTEGEILKHHKNLEKVTTACESLEESNNNSNNLGGLDKALIELQDSK